MKKCEECGIEITNIPGADFFPHAEGCSMRTGQQGWQERLSEVIYACLKETNYHELLEPNLNILISSLLQEEREALIREVEGIRKDFLPLEHEKPAYNQRMGYNEACYDIITLIKK